MIDARSGLFASRDLLTMNTPWNIVVSWMLCLALTAFSTDAGSEPDPAVPSHDDLADRKHTDPNELPIGFTEATFGDVHRADASAAITAWAASLAREAGSTLSPQPVLVRGRGELSSLVGSGQLQIAVTTTPEFLSLGLDSEAVTLFASLRDEQFAERCVLLVRTDATIESLADLRGLSLVTLEGPRMSIGPFWLDSILAESGLGSANEFFGRVEPVKKMTGAVLPVFFGRSDACIVTETGFETAVEMNPQIGRYVRVLVRSEPHVPTVGFFHPEFSGELRTSALDAILSVSTTEAGKQILKLFQVEGFDLIPASELASTEVLISHSRLLDSPLGNVTLSGGGR